MRTTTRVRLGLRLSLLLGLAGAALGCQGQLRLHGGVVAPAPVVMAGQASVTVDVSFFGIPLAGAQDVVFVLDRSGSMDTVAAGFAGQDAGMGAGTALLTDIGATIANEAAGGPLPSKMEAAKAELIRTLRALPDGTRFTIVFFDETVNAMSPTLLTLSPHTREHAIRFVGGIDTGGSTAAVPAMRAAYTAGAARVVLLSDGLANEGGSGGELLAEARAQMARGVRFDAVGLGISQDAALLRTLASEGGGQLVMR
jgi:Mg-chelatase subunit ChlD